MYTSFTFFSSSDNKSAQAPADGVHVTATCKMNIPVDVPFYKGVTLCNINRTILHFVNLVIIITHITRVECFHDLKGDVVTPHLI